MIRWRKMRTSNRSISRFLDRTVHSTTKLTTFSTTRMRRRMRRTSIWGRSFEGWVLRCKEPRREKPWWGFSILMLFISTYSRSHNSSFAKLMQSWPIIFINHWALILILWPSRVICVNDLIFFRGLGKVVE